MWPLQKVVERFGRDCSKPAGEDLAQRVFLTEEGLIRVTYHLEDDRIIPTQRSFAKFQEWPPSQRQQVFSPDMVSTYLVSESVHSCLILYCRTLKETGHNVKDTGTA